MKVAVFRRLLVLELDDDDLEIGAEVALDLAKSNCEANDPCFTSLLSVIGPVRRPCMFMSANGWAINVDRRDRIRFVYWFAGFTEVPACHAMKAKDCDLDFGGYVEGVANPDGSRSLTFVGCQDDCFASVSDFGILAPREFCGAGARNDAIIWDTPHRVDVQTIERFPIQWIERNQLVGATGIGDGWLIWTRNERHTDRFGSVMLATGVEDASEHIPLITSDIVGKTGNLVAEVLSASPCDGVRGDSYRMIFPVPVQTGELLWLGSGQMFSDDAYSIGCQPSDGRAMDWLNPRALYAVKSQFVRLHFVPNQQSMEGQE